MPLATTQPITHTNYLYQGDHLERDLNIYFTADGRYYDPWLGKYLQPDPIGGPPLIPQAADRYQYAGNSPTGVGGIQSSGRSSTFLVDLGKGVSSGVLGKAVESGVKNYANSVTKVTRQYGWLQLSARYSTLSNRGIADAFELLALQDFAGYPLDLGVWYNYQKTSEVLPC